MKKNLRLFLLMLLIGTSGLMVSCKDDELESITLRRSGDLKVTIKNGESPVANTQIRFYNANTGNELDIVATDADGVINFGKLNEGNYSISFEVSEPYGLIEQEFQVVSGESKEYTVQVADYRGTLNVFLLDRNYNEIITEDLHIGVAIVPNNDGFKKAFTNADIIALASDIKYFGAEGKISFDNIPTGEYKIYQVLADTIVRPLYYEDDEDYASGNIKVERLDETFFNVEVNPNIERLYNNHWTLTSAVNYNTDEADSDFPVESITFSRIGSETYGTYTMNLTNGITARGDVSYSGGTYISLYNAVTNKDNISVTFNESTFNFDENGRIIMRFSYFRVRDNSTSEYLYDQSYIEVTLE